MAVAARDLRITRLPRLGSTAAQRRRPQSLFDMLPVERGGCRLRSTLVNLERCVVAVGAGGINGCGGSGADGQRHTGACMTAGADGSLEVYIAGLIRSTKRHEAVSDKSRTTLLKNRTIFNPVTDPRSGTALPRDMVRFSVSRRGGPNEIAL